MIRSNIFIFIICLILILGLSTFAMSKVSIYAQDIDARFEYDNNVTRQKLPKDYQYGIIWRLNTGFGLKDIIPINRVDTDARYTLSMRDVTTTNNEDYNSHDFDIGIKIREKISFKESFKIWNSQSDLFHFSDNTIEAGFEHSLTKQTRLYTSYRNEQKWFQNKAPEVHARNFYYHQLGLNIYHSIHKDFTVQIGYVNQIKTYNRRPIDFKEGKPVVLDGIQKDHQDMIVLGFVASVFNNTNLLLSNQIVRSNSNSRAFDFNGNRTQIIVLSNPIDKLWLEVIYQIVAYNLGAYQTPDLGYELSDNRTDDQSGIRLGLTYGISDQVSLIASYERIKNTVFFTKDYYESNKGSIGVKVKF